MRSSSVPLIARPHVVATPLALRRSAAMSEVEELAHALALGKQVGPPTSDGPRTTYAFLNGAVTLIDGEVESVEVLGKHGDRATLGPDEAFFAAHQKLGRFDKSEDAGRIHRLAFNAGNVVYGTRGFVGIEKPSSNGELVMLPVELLEYADDHGCGAFVNVLGEGPWRAYEFEFGTVVYNPDAADPSLRMRRTR